MQFLFGALLAAFFSIALLFGFGGNTPFTLFNRAAEAELPPLALEERTVIFGDGTETTFSLPAGFGIAVAAEGLGKARFMAMSPDGRMFVPDLVNYNLSHEGKIYILEGWNEETKRFETVHTYLSGLRGPNSVAFYTDPGGQTWLYIALTAHLIRYPYNAGDTAPQGEPEIIMEFPNTQTPGETSVVWHITRTLRFHNDRLYVAIGSGCNSCEQAEGELRGMIIAMDPDGSNIEVYADGLRNSVGIAFANGTLFATANGVDHLGADRPDELLHRIEQGRHYGWPYCYETGGEVAAETPERWERGISCAEVPRSFAAFDPRSAPLGLAYFEDAHEALSSAFLVALHGSFDPGMMRGYEIVRVSADGGHSVFMDGFQKETGEVVGRPVDILQRDSNSFFFTDDHGGRVYLVYAE